MPQRAGDLDDELDSDAGDADDADDGNDGPEREVADDADADDEAEGDGARGSGARLRHVDDEGAYVCGSCGEEIVVPLDRTGGERQSYVEDCPVCCVPNEITVDFDEDGSARVWARPE